MKKKGNKKKINSSKKEKGFFSFFTKRKVAPVVLAFVFLALAILLPFFTTGNAVNSSVSGHASFLDNPVSIKFPNAMNWLNIGNTWKDVIVYIIILGLIFVMLLDILLLTSLFSEWASFFIAVGFSIIGALTNVIRQISIWAITIAAGLGVVAGFIEIIVAIVVFVGLVFASPKIAGFAARRKAQAMKVRAIKSAGEAGGAISFLRRLQRKDINPRNP